MYHIRNMKNPYYSYCGLVLGGLTLESYIYLENHKEEEKPVISLPCPDCIEEISPLELLANTPL